MSSSEVDAGDATLIKAKVTANEVTVSETIVNEKAAEIRVAETNAELKEISKDISLIGKGALKSLEGFRTFILRGNVVDLAIGIVIGAAFTAVVNALVSDLITPLIPVSKTGG